MNEDGELGDDYTVQTNNPETDILQIGDTGSVKVSYGNLKIEFCQ